MNCQLYEVIYSKIIVGTLEPFLDMFNKVKYFNDHPASSLVTNAMTEKFIFVVYLNDHYFFYPPF